MSGAQQSLGVGELDRSRSQFFTPAALAQRLWQWARPPHSSTPARLRLLEPSAGLGALLGPAAASSQPFACIAAYEIDPVNVAHLRERFGTRVDVYDTDFLAEARMGALGRFDLALLNPPFENDGDIDFARECCKVSTHACGIFPTRMLHSQRRAEFWRWHDIRRAAVMSRRPQFGGPMGGKTDFLALDLSARTHARRQGEAHTTNVEWWD